MSTAMLLLLGLAIGVVVGWPLQSLDGKPVLRSIVAMQLSFMFSAVACGLIWMMQASSREGIVAISFGLTEILLTVLPISLVAAGIHGLLGRVAATSPGVVRNRAVILGAIGGMCGSVLSGPFGTARNFLR